MDRIDALQGHSRARFRRFTGQVLDATVDDQLQGIVAAAAAGSRFPTAALSLVLERTVMVRAAVGLAEPIAVARGVDRAVSFCQFVVRDEAPVAVDDATFCAELPQACVGVAGVRSYIGVPVNIGGDVVGALCVSGPEPGIVEGETLDLLLGLADVASRRLTELAGPEAFAPPLRLVTSAVSPVFGEIRNALAPLCSAGAVLRVIAADAAPLARVACAGAVALEMLPLLTDAALALEELGAFAGDLDVAGRRAADNVALLEGVLGHDGQRGPLHQVLATATRLSHHATKIAGGVCVRASLAAAVVEDAVGAASLCAAAITELARSSVADGGVDVDADGDATEIAITLRAQLPPGAARACRRNLLRLAPDADIDVDVDSEALVLRFPRVGMGPLQPAAQGAPRAGAAGVPLAVIPLRSERRAIAGPR